MKRGNAGGFLSISPAPLERKRVANEQLGEIRRTFFTTAIDAEFYQQRDLLPQAIAFPGRPPERALFRPGHPFSHLLADLSALGDRAGVAGRAERHGSLAAARPALI